MVDIDEVKKEGVEAVIPVLTWMADRQQYPWEDEKKQA